MSDWLRKYADFYKAIFIILYRGAKFSYHRFMEKNIQEKIFLLAVITGGILLSAPWRSYEMQFPDQPGFHHGIYTDDFLWFFLAFIMLFCSTIKMHFTMVKFLRLAGLTLSGIFLLLAIIFPARIAPTTEATFTWQFFTFLAVNAVLLITGIPGIVSYAQNSFKN